MSVKLLIKGKGSFVPVIKSERTLNDVINQLDLDNVGGLGQRTFLPRSLRRIATSLFQGIHSFATQRPDTSTPSRVRIVK